MKMIKYSIYLVFLILFVGSCNFVASEEGVDTAEACSSLLVEECCNNTDCVFCGTEPTNATCQNKTLKCAAENQCAAITTKAPGTTSGKPSTAAPKSTPTPTDNCADLEQADCCNVTANCSFCGNDAENATCQKAACVAPAQSQCQAAPTTTTKAPTTNGTTTSGTPSSSESGSSGSGSGQKFDAASFIGGIILCGGLIAIGFFALKFYRARKDQNYHTL